MKEIISTEHAPAAIGPYAQAIRAGQFVYTSGQIPLDPKTGVIVSGGIEAEAKQVLANLKAVLNAAGADFKDVVKATVFLTDLADFATVNGIYAEAFGGEVAARSCIQVAALPAEARIEIEAVAFLG